MVIRLKNILSLSPKPLPQQHTCSKVDIRLCSFGSLEYSMFFKARRKSLSHPYRIAYIKFTNKNNITTILCGFIFLLGINKSDKNEIGDKHDILVKLCKK